MLRSFALLRDIKSEGGKAQYAHFISTYIPVYTFIVRLSWRPVHACMYVCMFWQADGVVGAGGGLVGGVGAPVQAGAQAAQAGAQAVQAGAQAAQAGAQAAQKTAAGWGQRAGDVTKR